MRHFWQKFVVYLTLASSLLLSASLWAAGVSVPPAFPNKLPPDIALIKHNGVLRVAFVKNSEPPFFMINSKGQWSGIEVDLAQMIADELQVKLVIVPTDTYDHIIDKVANGQADLGMGLINIMPARELRVSFTNPYYIYHPHVLVNRMQAAKRGWPMWQWVEKAETTTEPFTLGYLKGSVGGTLIQKMAPSAQAIPYNTVYAAMDDVVAGKIFAAGANSPMQAQDYLASHSKASLVAADVEVSQVTYLIGAAMPWQYIYFRDWLNLYMDYLVQNGLETKLFQKYNQTVDPSNEFSYPK
jgi:ABC-type amino acid transport substrate-binding protein